MELKGDTVFHKLWYFLRTYILTVARFDLFLQGTLLVIILLEANCYLLLRRDAGTGSMPTINEDWVYMGAGLAQFVFGAILAWSGRGWRNYCLSMWLGLTAVSGLIVVGLRYDKSTEPVVDLCGGGVVSPLMEPFNDDTTAIVRQVFLILTIILCSLCLISIWAHGLTYLDDHEPQNGPYFYGILISIRLSLGLSGQNWLRAGAVRDDWWEAHLSLAMLVLMFSILFNFFAPKQPGYKEIEVKDESGFFESLGRIFSNNAVIVQTIGISFLNVAVFGFVNYDSAYVQSKYQVETARNDPQTSRVVSDIFRSLVVIFFVMIFRMRFSVRRSEGVKANTSSRVGGVVAIFVAIFFAVLASLPCGLDPLAGTETGEFIPPTCSQDCGCDSARYGFSPVCDLDSQITYFSPCNAGCSQYEDLNGFMIYHNCTCGGETLFRGSCTLPSCRLTFGFYQVFYTITIAVSAASFLMQGMVILRAVERHDKPIALGASFAIVGILSIPGHMLYMLLSHLWCAYPGTDNGTCVFHVPTIWGMAAVSSGLALISGIISIIASRCSTGQTNAGVIAYSNGDS